MNSVQILATLAVISLSLLVLGSCSSTKKWKKHIDGPVVFGAYGGFAGSYNEYTIEKDGAVFHKKSLKGTSTQIQILSDELKQKVFKDILEYKIYEESLDDPGNLTYFLKFTHKGELCDLKWGGQNDPPEHLLNYYNFLSKNINGSSPTM